MREVRIYIEADWLGEHEDGSPIQFGASLVQKLEQSAKDISHADLLNGLNALQILRELGVMDVTKLKDARFISPEEYKIKFGDGEDDEHECHV